MLLDKSTFNDVRLDTYAFFVDDLGLYYHYARALLDEFNKAVNSLDTTDIPLAESSLNQLLSLIREVHTGRSRLLSSDVAAILTEQGLDAEELEASYRTGTVTIQGHSSTKSIACPLLIRDLAESQISSTREAITPSSDLLRVNEELSEYLSSETVAALVGGTVSKQILATGTSTESLRTYIEDFTDTKPVQIQVNVQVLIPSGVLNFETRDVEFNFVVTNDGAVNTAISEDSNVNSWVAMRSRVELGAPGIGTSGPMFEYPLSTSMVDTSLLLRPGMCLTNNTSAVVSKVLGERVTLTTPVSTHGSLQFEYKACKLWGDYLSLFTPIKVVGDTEEDQVNSLLAQAHKRAKSCMALLNEIPNSVNKIRFDIKAAHHAVSADYAYNLLERGRLIEYHQLTEQQANRGDVMATAAAHIRAGTRL